MSDTKDHLPPEYRKALDQFGYDEMLQSMETQRCSNCLEPFDGKEAIYARRALVGDPEAPEVEQTEHYCLRCVTIDPSRRKAPAKPLR